MARPNSGCDWPEIDHGKNLQTGDGVDRWTFMVWLVDIYLFGVEKNHE
jgi:hypothetical protein